MVLAFSGPVGSGVDRVIEQFTSQLAAINYKCVPIKLSKIIRALMRDDAENFQLLDPGVGGKERYQVLQDAGNILRSKYSGSFLAEGAAICIAQHRVESHPDKKIDEIIPERVAYLVDQLKHPEEVNLLRKVYGNLFFAIGVLCARDERESRLVNYERLTSPEAAAIMERDRREDIKHGQQLDKTLQLSDYFVNNASTNNKDLEAQIARFLSLVHGETLVTPTKDEYGMYMAYSAGLKSACISRQVGAAILDSKGNLIATGCNDVPSPGGGLYQEDSNPDQRCIHKDGGRCFNTKLKRELQEDLERLLGKYVEEKLPEFISKLLADTGAESAKVDSYVISRVSEIIKPNEIADQLYNETRLRDLLEFSRSVHAEMDAITTVARVGLAPVSQGTLYSTTFPCHLCARHIVASGIQRVVFIEPYEKSLALTLHSDAISVDAQTPSGSGKVNFVHFEGVAPIRYSEFFLARPGRKNEDGSVNRVPLRTSPKIVPQYLDRYTDFESKISEYVIKSLKIRPDSITCASSDTAK